MVKTDFTYTYCYKDKNGSIGLTNSLPQDEVLIYTYDKNGTFITLLDGQDTYKASENKVYAGIVIIRPDTPEGYINEKIDIKVQKNCETDIKSLAYYKLKKGTTNEYEFSGNIYKRFYDDDRKIIGRTVILGKTDDGVKIAEGFSIEISPLIQKSTLTSEELKYEYDAVEQSRAWTPETKFDTKKDLGGPGYILLKITENGKVITKDNPGYIRVRK